MDIKTCRHAFWGCRASGLCFGLLTDRGGQAVGRFLHHQRSYCLTTFTSNQTDKRHIVVSVWQKYVLICSLYGVTGGQYSTLLYLHPSNDLHQQSFSRDLCALFTIAIFVCAWGRALGRHRHRWHWHRASGPLACAEAWRVHSCARIVAPAHFRGSHCGNSRSTVDTLDHKIF